jgi:type II secretory pathway predicted ATPase ExeA
MGVNMTVCWEATKSCVTLPFRAAWSICPFKSAIKKTVETATTVLKVGAYVAGGVAAYQVGTSQIVTDGLSAAAPYVESAVSHITPVVSSLASPVADAISVAANSALDSAKSSVMGYWSQFKVAAIQTFADLASMGVMGTVHFVARRILSAATSIWSVLGLFFEIFKAMDTPAQIVVGGAVLLRLTGPKLTKGMRTFCISPDLPRLARWGGSSCQSPLRALIQKKMSQIPWLNKAEPKPIFNEDVSNQIEPFIEANRQVIASGEGFFKNILLLGPPGTGKTMLAKYIAKESGMNYIEIDGGTFALLEQYQQGLALKALNELLTFVKDSGRPLLLFIDEADGLLQRPGVTTDIRVKQSELQFRSALLAATGVSNKLLVVLTTNHPDKMDRALLSRVQAKVRVSHPNLESRTKILTEYIDKHFKKRPERATCLNDASIRELAEKTEGMSGRDLLFLVDNFVVAQSTSKNKRLTPKMIESMLDLALHALREEYEYNAAQAAATNPAPATATIPASAAAPVPAAEPAPTILDVKPEPTVPPAVELAQSPKLDDSTPETPIAKPVESISQKISNYVVRVFSQMVQMFREVFSMIGRFFSVSPSKPTVQIPNSVLGSMPIAS